MYYYLPRITILIFPLKFHDFFLNFFFLLAKQKESEDISVEDQAEVVKKLKTALEDCTAVCILEGFQKQEHMMLVDTILKELGKFNEFFDNFLACWLFKKLVKFFFFFCHFHLFLKKKFQVVLKLNWQPRKGTLYFRPIILFVNTFNHSPQIQS